MGRTDQAGVSLRIVIERPVIGVLHSLQGKDDLPLDPKASIGGEALVFDVPIHVAPGPKFFGEQVRREGPVRRFIYIRVGQLAGDPASPWSRRIKIDIHDIENALLDCAMKGDAVIETTIDGTGADGTPACATVRPLARRIAPR
nr:DUF5990 family protein [Sphingomonas sp. Y57]